MLKSIKLTKLFGRFDYELKFSDEGIMIITGPNGYGKSTILRIINNFCNDSLDKVLSYTFKKLMIVCENGSISLVKNKDAFKINDIELPYPNENWERRKSFSQYFRHVGFEDYADMRTSEKISLLGGQLKQSSLWDDQIVDEQFAFAILDTFDIQSSTKEKKKQ